MPLNAWSLPSGSVDQKLLAIGYPTDSQSLMVMGCTECWVPLQVLTLRNGSISVQVDAKNDDGRTDRKPDERLEWFQTFYDIGDA